MEVSVIIPTYNRRDLLKKCLHSLFNQTISKKNYEIIVVDNEGNNKIRGLIKSLKKRYKNLKYFNQKHKGPAAARNFGIKNSKGKIIAFTDDDCIVDKNWIKAITKAHKVHPQHVGVGGRTYNLLKNNRIANIRQFLLEYSIQSQDMQNSILKKLKTYVFPHSLKKIREVITLPSNNVSYKRIFLDKYLFDTTFNMASGEDSELNWRLNFEGFKLVYIPSLKVYHHNVSSLKGFLSQTFNHGRNAYKIKLKHNNFYPIFFDNFLQIILFISAFFFMPIFKLFQIKEIKNFFIYPPYFFLYEFSYRAGIIYDAFLKINLENEN